MLHRYAAAAVLIAAGAVPAGASAQPKPPEAPPAAFARAVQCRAITNAEERLACYDREVAALEQAQRSNEIRVVDRQQVRRTRRTLFGLALPDLDIFGGDDDGEGVSEIQTTIRNVQQDASGKYSFTLADGARWRQIDSLNLNVEPRPGHAIRIRRAAMGSYLANIGKQRAIRVRRDR